jgi:hypothetical protein
MGDAIDVAAASSPPKATKSSPLLKGLVGASSFVRHNPKSDRFKVRFGFWRKKRENKKVKGRFADTDRFCFFVPSFFSHKKTGHPLPPRRLLVHGRDQHVQAVSLGGWRKRKRKKRGWSGVEKEREKRV